jgi:hypothetical protein
MKVSMDEIASTERRTGVRLGWGTRLRQRQAADSDDGVPLHQFRVRMSGLV